MIENRNKLRNGYIMLSYKVEHNQKMEVTLSIAALGSSRANMSSTCRRLMQLILGYNLRQTKHIKY